MPLRIAVDFDNTLFLNDWPRVGVAVPHARSSMRKMKRSGHFLFIWSCRGAREFGNPIGRAEGIRHMTEALQTYRIPFDDVDYGDVGKRRADLYIDDRNLGIPLREFRGSQVVDWLEAYKLIRLAEKSRDLQGR